MKSMPIKCDVSYNKIITYKMFCKNYFFMFWLLENLINKNKLSKMYLRQEYKLSYSNTYVFFLKGKSQFKTFIKNFFLSVSNSFCLECIARIAKGKVTQCQHIYHMISLIRGI